MRLWSLHPRYMDRQGLLALWRESLLAKAVLRGETTGYRHHPQLLRFQATGVPRSAINAYLYEIHAESAARGYRFDGGKVGPRRSMATIPVTSGQVQYEWAHLLTKLSVPEQAFVPSVAGLWRTGVPPTVSRHPRRRRAMGARWHLTKCSSGCVALNPGLGGLTNAVFGFHAMRPRG